MLADTWTWTAQGWTRWHPATSLPASALARPARGRGDRLWVNPDCGLKTSGYPETEQTLRNMVAAARQLRARVAEHHSSLRWMGVTAATLAAGHAGPC